MSKVIQCNKQVVTTSKDRKKLPKPITCNECIIDHGCSGIFKYPAKKFWHIKINHSKRYAEKNERQRINKELRELKIISEKNQKGIL